MSLPEGLSALQSHLTALQRLLSRFGEQGVIIGGIATGFLGRPRLTVDIDAMFLLSVKDIPNLMQAAKQEGIDPRIEAAEAFARKNRVVLLQHTESGIGIDISLGILPFEEEMVQRSIVHKIGSLALRLPTPEDLIILKAVAHRPKDLQDIRDIMISHPTLDQARIERWLKDFGETLDQPDLWERIRALLNE